MEADSLNDVENPPKSSNETIFSGEAQCKLFAAEEKHFWFNIRAKLIIDRLKDLKLLDKSFEVAEIGCGNGYTSTRLMPYFQHYHASEGSKEALANLEKRLQVHGLDDEKYTLSCIDLKQEKLKGEYDLLFAFDVIEHIAPKDLDAVLKSISSSIKSDGHFVLTVPAFSWLWSPVDDQSGHFQRFDIQSMTALLESAGFKVTYHSYLFFMVLPFYILQRALYQFMQPKDSSDEKNPLAINPVVNSVLYVLSKIDFVLLKIFGKLGLGSSLFCVARKNHS